MQYNIRWLNYSEQHLIKELSLRIYANPKNSYPLNLDAKTSSIYSLFMVPPDTVGAETRKIAVVTDEFDQIVVATGVRELYSMPAWLLSWTLSSVSSVAFVKIWQDLVRFICAYFEDRNINEFYVINPAEREEAYRRMTKFMRERYWTFVETTIPENQTTDYSLYNSFMGWALYPYAINIRRYILKREIP